MVISPFRRSLTAFALVLIAAWSLVPSGRTSSHSEHAGTDPLTEYEPLPRFDARWKQWRPTARSSETAIQLSTRPGASGVLRWNEELDLPHHLLSYSWPLSGPSADDPVEIAKTFVRRNRSLFRVGDSELDAARVAAYETDERGGFTRVVLEQRVSGIRVFDSETLFIVDRAGRLVSESGCFVPDVGSLSLATTPGLTPEEALRSAARWCGAQLAAPLTAVVERLPARERVVFSSDEVDSRSETSLVYYPVTKRDVRLAYQVLLYGVPTRIDSYLILVDARTGELLRRESLTFAAGAPRARVFMGESPNLVDREVVLLSGDSIASPQGWVADNRTEGNNTQVLVNPDLTGGSSVSVNEQGEFDFPLDLTSGQSPLKFSDASATNLFCWVNVAHDRFYSLGFDEKFRNFQLSNFDRAGTGNDPVRAETLRGAAVNPRETNQLVRNNAFFSGTLEGSPPLLAMLMWTLVVNGQTVELDSSYDAGVIIHEYTHGVSTRLAGTDNVIGLRSTQGGGMGEGWSDFFAMSFLDRGDAGLAAPHTAGEYLTNQPARGIRSYPYTIDYALNPLTFRDIAFNSEVHAQGTVWCTMLWELRQSLIERYGFDRGRETAERLVVAGLKLLPITPLFTDGRDGILLADRLLNDGANQELIWRAFARRGLGASAITSLVMPQTGLRLSVTEAYDLPPEVTAGSLIVNDKPPALAIIGEPVRLVVTDRDLAPFSTVELRATNLRSGQSITLILPETGAGRFEGSLRIPFPQEDAGPALLGEAGDTVLIRYQNVKNQNGTSETLEQRLTVARRVVVYTEGFEQGPAGWSFPANSDSTPNYWHVSQRRAASPPSALYFAKEKVAKSFTPQSSRGAALAPQFDLGGVLRPRLEFDWFFSGFAGDSTASADGVSLTVLNQRSSPQEPSLGFVYILRPLSGEVFRSEAVDLSFIEGRRGGLTLSFAASNAGVKRKGFEGFFMDNVRVTAASTR